MGAAVNALPGGEIVPAMDRGLLDAAEFNNAIVRPPARLPRRVQGLHAAELPPERRAVRDHVQQDQVRRAAGQDEGDHRQRRRGRRRPTCRGRRSTATRRTTSSCRPRTRSSSTRRRTRSCRSSSRSTTQVAAKKSADNPLFKEIVDSQKAFAERAVTLGPGHQRQPPHGLQPLLRQAGGAGEEGLSDDAATTRHHPARSGWLSFFVRHG